jgi:glutamyl-Q tRNA(Asp) synthetase
LTRPPNPVIFDLLKWMRLPSITHDGGPLNREIGVVFPVQNITRFAPSPTGYLHIGHIASAIYVWGIGAKLEASVMLRIEDHDRGRSRSEYELSIFQDLAWLGFQPTNSDFKYGGSSEYRQSDAHQRYEAALMHLIATQQVYACTCSRKEILSTMRASDTSGDDVELRYAGTCRNKNIPLDTPQASLRLALPDRDIPFSDLNLGLQIQNPYRQCGDLLLKDRHGHWTYQFAVTVDDLCQSITHVIRGADLLSSTGRQILLGSWLGRKQPAQFFHHPLIIDANGRKLGKRFFSEAIRKRREAGESPDRLLGEAAHLVGILPHNIPISVNDLVSLMSGESSSP